MNTNNTAPETDIQDRLKQIAAALAAKQTASVSSDPRTVSQNGPALQIHKAALPTCPTDPAERAACDSCQ